MRTDGDLRTFLAGLLSETGGDAVLSGELAAEMLAPHLPSHSAIVHCLDPQAFAELSDAARRRAPGEPGAPGHVLVDLADRGAGQFRSEHEGLPLASPIQVYVDLARDPSRGRDAAEHLRHRVIGF